MLSKFTAVGGIVEGRQHALQKGPYDATEGAKIFVRLLEKLDTYLVFLN